jgi:hypothetical protein
MPAVSEAVSHLPPTRLAGGRYNDDKDWSAYRPTMGVIVDYREQGPIDTGILDANGEPSYGDTTPERVWFGFHYYPPIKRRRNDPVDPSRNSWWALLGWPRSNGLDGPIRIGRRSFNHALS